MRGPRLARSPRSTPASACWSAPSPCWRRRCACVPQHEGLRLALADGLARCGRHDEARAQLSRLVEQAGWRRTPQARAPAPAPGRDRARRRATPRSRSPSSSRRRRWTARTRRSCTQLAEVAEAAGDLERGRARLPHAAGADARGRDAAPGRSRAGPGADGDPAAALRPGAQARATPARPTSCSSRRWRRPSRIPSRRRACSAALLAAGAHDELARLFEKRLARAAGTPARGGDLRRDGREPARAGQAWRRPSTRSCAPSRRRPSARTLHEPLAELARACGQAGAARRSPARARRAAAPQGRHGRRQHAAAAGGGDRRARLRRSRRARWICTAAPRRCSRGRSTCCPASPGSRSKQGERRRMRSRRRRCSSWPPPRRAAPDAAAEALYRAAGARARPRRDARRRHRQSVRGDREEPRSRARLGAGRGRGRARGRAGQDPAALRAHRPPVGRRAPCCSTTSNGGWRRRTSRSAEVREAVDLAVALHRDDRMEPLLVRLADIAAERADGRDDATWALLELLRIKKAAGDLDAAAQHPAARRGACCPLERVMPLARDLAERAGRAGNRRLGAELLERLRASAPADESVWRPLLDHYVGLRDRDGLARLVAETLPLLPDVAQRNQLRMALARLRLADDGGDGAAADDPAGRAARGAAARRRRWRCWPATTSAAAPRATSSTCWRRRSRRRSRPRDPDGGRRGGAFAWAACSNARTPSARPATYERALAVAPRRGELLKRLLALRPGRRRPRREHAELMEAVLDGRDRRRGGAPGPRAGGGLDDARRRGRPCGACWRRGTRRRRASDDVLRGAGTPLPRQAGLGAARGPARHRGRAPRATPSEAAALLRRGRVAASGPPGRRDAAASSCCGAPARAPRRTSRSSSSSRARWSRTASWAPPSPRSARRSTTRASRPEQRLPLHLLRAKLEARRGDHRAAVTRAGGGVRAVAGRGRRRRWWRSWRRGASDAAAGTPPRELREATLRLAELARGAGDAAQARRLLDELVARGAADADTVRLTWELAEAEGDAESAFSAAQQFMQLAEGDAQIAAAAPAGRARRAHRHRRPTPRRPSRPRWRRTRTSSALIDLLAPLYEQTGELAQAGGAAARPGATATADEEQRFEQLRRAGAFALQAQDASLAVMALNEALVVRPGDEETALLLSDAYVLAGALEDAAALMKPLVAARKGKASPALAALHVRLAHIAGLAGDRAGRARRARPRAGRRQEERRARGRGRRPRRGGRRRRAGAEGAAPDRRPQRARPDQRRRGVPASGAHRPPPRRDRARRHVRPARVARRAKGDPVHVEGARLPRRARRPALAPAAGPEGAQVVAVTSGRSGPGRSCRGRAAA